MWHHFVLGEVTTFQVCLRKEVNVGVKMKGTKGKLKKKLTQWKEKLKGNKAKQKKEKERGRSTAVSPSKTMWRKGGLVPTSQSC
jgi:hypothetical protein